MAQHAGDRSPDRMQRLLSRASWDTLAAMSEVRRFGAAGLAEAARRGRRRGGLVVATIDETGQEKAGVVTAGVKRQCMGCAGRVANGINTVHVSLVREKYYVPRIRPTRLPRCCLRAGTARQHR